MKDNCSTNLSIDIPDGWEIEDDSVCTTISRSDGVGAPQLSTALKDCIVEDADLLDFATDNLAHGTQPQPVTLGRFSGFEINYEAKQTWWRIWYLKSENLMIMATYNCDLQHAGNEDSQIDAMLATLE